MIGGSPEMCFVCYKIRKDRYESCTGICKALLAFEEVDNVDDPCLLCLVNFPGPNGRYWNCTEACQAKLQYLARKAEEGFKATAGDSIRRLNAERERLRTEED